MATWTDYRFDQWVERAVAFTQGLGRRVEGEVESEVVLEPPLSEDALDRLSRELGCLIPAALRKFLATGAGGLEFTYWWTPIEPQRTSIHSIKGFDDDWAGGGVLCQSDLLVEWLHECRRMAEETWISDFPGDNEFWTKSLPILALETGDFLGLDGRESSDDPAVVYLSHDDTSVVIAPSFTRFLVEWERLYYVEPDILCYCSLDDNGMLSAESENGRLLKAAFGLES